MSVTDARAERREHERIDEENAGAFQISFLSAPIIFGFLPLRTAADRLANY